MTAAFEQPQTPTRPSPARFQHEALLYAGAAEFVEGTAGFVRRGLSADEAVLVAVIEPRASMLREELGSDAHKVRFLDMENVGRNPARIIPAWQAWVDEHAPSGRGFRGIGEPIWVSRSLAELLECQQHEQLLNTAFDDGPGWSLLCPYDTTSLPEDVIARAHDTHPGVVTGDGRLDSSSYPHPDMSHSAMFSDPLPEPTEPLRELAFDASGLVALRDLVAAFAAEAGRQDRAEELILIVNELATNSLLYGGGRGILRLWQDGAKLVCEVRDAGLIVEPLVGRRRPSPSARGGAGLWIANQLCDLVQIRSAAEFGTVVRAYLGTSV